MAFTAEDQEWRSLWRTTNGVHGGGGRRVVVFLCALAGEGGKHSNAVVRGHGGSSAVVRGHGGSNAVVHGQGGRMAREARVWRGGRRHAFGGKREESARENEN